jgi:hypothetical protein
VQIICLLLTVFVDLKEAFDTVIHAGIKIKLLDIGVGSWFYNIIKQIYESLAMSNHIVTYIIQAWGFIAF